MTTNREVSSSFNGQLRVRVCGILLKEGQLLMAQHKPFGPAGELWIPPGGGMEFGESATECLVREFKEETNLEVQVGSLLFVHETHRNSIHAIELFFEITHYSGEVKTGTDPELSSDNQILRDVKFISQEKINKMPVEMLHNVFNYLKNKEGLISFESLLRINEKYIS